MNRSLLLLFLLLLGTVVHGQQVTIRGQVLSDDDGKPVPGASVIADKSTIGEQTSETGVIRSSALGTVTDVEGNFSLTLPAGIRTIRVSFLGFASKVIDISGKTFIRVRLTNDENQLKEVIVTGYNSIKKSKNTTASSKVSFADIRQSGVVGVDQMLQGQVAGVVVTTLNGGPGAAPKIRIRGTASLNGNQEPLWVLDGIPLEGDNMPAVLDKDNIDQLRNFPIAGVNPDDIEDITILKDAAATAIYGVRAANGVIVITTKNGKKGPMQVNVNANSFIGQRPDFSRLNLMNSNEKVDWELGLAAREDLTYRDTYGAVARILNQNGQLNAFRQGGFSALNAATQESINNLRSVNTDWGKELYQTSVNQQYTASISGGNDDADYYFSAGYYNEKGSTKGTGLKRYNVTLKTNLKVSDKLKVGAGLFGTASDRESYISEASAQTKPATYSRNVNPYLRVRDENGAFVYDPDITGSSNLAGDIYLPFNAIEERENTDYTFNNKSFKGLFNLEWKIIQPLKFRTEMGIQIDENNSEKYGDQESFYVRKFRAGTSYYNSSTKKYQYFLPAGGMIENQNTSFFQYNWKNILEFNTVIDQKHEIEAMAGSEFRRNNNDNILSRGFGYDPKTLTTSPIVFPSGYSGTSTTTYQPYNRMEARNAYASFYGILSYTYDRRYTLYGSIRYDGSDLFGVDPKYKWLPIYSVSGAWNAKQESFLEDVKWLSNLKLRASYGLQGNIDKTSSPYLLGYFQNGTILPGYPEQQITVQSPPNDKLRWEKTSTLNGGIDLGVLNNRIQLTVDYYNRHGKDLLAMRALPLETGFAYLNVNWSRVKNEGLEVSLYSRNIESRNFSWSTDFNISRNKSKVTRQIARDTDRMPSKEGYPVNSVFVIKTAGLDDQGYVQFYQGGQVVSFENFFKLYDPWADLFPGELTESKLTYEEYRNLFSYAGDADPKFTGGFINKFRYKNFDLAVTTSFFLDKTVLRKDMYNPAQVDRGINYSRELLNTWTPQNTASSLPRIISYSTENADRWMVNQWNSVADPMNTYQYYDIWAKSLSYLRVNSIRLGYTLPSAVSKRIGARHLRFSVEGNNLFVASKNYDGYFDPETFGDIYAQPITKSINIGINASF
ncbi:TonB-linked SusC/RagA family outer membrane protein [Arcticibacter tournemirensis]|uniref:SusC/RagA family TonB-linked outer membrane protein n=1 Tax=Arcticibacter tournemirensis TaxID=699437 RepID=A0A5M9GUQ9_9SPHI|nr:SusC/RagA family TonB-linked outer membrane protein [Arcticibacter tournemirensis]KAA8478453.1 SusC/RagA family TonB-linked outer membrane protein [Arcticibacter tournemirensis]TQM48553.1 TonB-linked SusC/RagA family outer membrane protein [Arcticibacter tournemirensis]